MNREPYIYVHADDYGMTPSTCERIKECWEHGCLNSLSVVPNGCLSYAFEFKKEMDVPCAVHLNLVEGKALQSPEKLDLLVNVDGYMKNSFFNLLLLSLSPARKRLEKQLYLEIKEQILATMKYLNSEEIFLDSHQHTHMIPLVFKTMLQVVRDCNIPVKYLRISAEPLLPFLMEPSLYLTYKPINIIKNMVLNFLWLFEKKIFKKSGISTALFCGIIFSGKMDADRVMKVFPHFYKKAKKRGCDLEFLFHPGYIKDGEEFMDPYKTAFQQFYLSEGRKEENAALHDSELCKLIKKKNNLV